MLLRVQWRLDEADFELRPGWPSGYFECCEGVFKMRPNSVHARWSVFGCNPTVAWLIVFVQTHPPRDVASVRVYASDNRSRASAEI
jgi:hypothetical protein